MSELHRYDSRDELDAALTETITTQLTRGIASRGSASLVVSGGSTPQGLFKTLSSTELDWEKVTVLLADERWVPETHADSNSAMVKSLLLQGKAAAANWIGFGAGQEDADAELARITEILSAMDSFDVVILGTVSYTHLTLPTTSPV